MRRFIVLVALASAMGCATSGVKINPDQVTQIKEGVTTESEVIEMFGAPTNKTLTSDGKVLMTYTHSKVKSRAKNFIPVYGLLDSSMDMEIQTFQVLIDEKGIVEKYIMNDHTSEIKSGLIQ